MNFKKLQNLKKYIIKKEKNQTIFLSVRRLKENKNLKKH